MYTQASSGDGGKCVSLWNDKPAPHLRGGFSVPKPHSNVTFALKSVGSASMKVCPGLSCTVRPVAVA